MRVAAVPLKSLDRAKTRLASVLSPPERRELAGAMLNDVLDACLPQAGWDVWVISPQDEVLRLAVQRGARPLPEFGTTLRQAVRQVEAQARDEDCAELAVILADLPFATANAVAAVLGSSASVAAAPATSDGGTNALVRRPPSVIPARFGRSSFSKHRAEAYRRGVTFESIDTGGLGFDLDRPADLVAVIEAEHDSRTKAVCLRMGLAERLVNTPL
ncbi:MAG TPA: 2-phospho-L-lactate guanylyltransferase [Actinomycetota bacterium]|nr:2-phospho-L-lactate guanylyltransferase [Actinomycetota bacterium]